MSTLVDQARKFLDEMSYYHDTEVAQLKELARQLADRVQEMESTIQESLKVANHVQPEKEERRPLSAGQILELPGVEDAATEFLADLVGVDTHDVNLRDHPLAWSFLEEFLEKVAHGIGTAKPAPERVALTPLTERQIVDCLITSGCTGNVKMTYDSGPYEITRTSVNSDRLAKAIIDKFCEVNGITAPAGGGEGV